MSVHRFNRVANGQAQAARRWAPRSEPFTLSEHDLPEFAALAKSAEMRGIDWKDRVELYHRLGMTDEQKVAMETKLVRYFSSGKIPEALVARVVRFNVFYICDSIDGGPVYRDDFVKAYEDTSSTGGLSRRMKLAYETSLKILKSLDMKPKVFNRGRKRKSSSVLVRPSTNEDGELGKAKAAPEKEKNGAPVNGAAHPEVKLRKSDDLEDYQKGIIADAFSLNCTRKEAAKRAGVSEDQLDGLWDDLCLEALASSRYEKREADQKQNKMRMLRKFMR